MRARFVRLALAGFKSFAEPATVEILPGLTGIVGPNGCGKSNVTDALRWAMGEASARSLRGGEMDDVIFAGTTVRAGRNLAEVVVTLEADQAGGFPAPFGEQAEIAVARRIERGAGSHYRVNGRETRARDVQTLFADLASGARSSAMVSQGRVSALVSARPEERRLLLEEAAGITGLHARRAEAETRLRAAEANLERAEERRGMLETQLAGLQKQAKQAARYRTLSTTVGEAEALTLAIGRARAGAGKLAGEAALADAHSAVTRAASGASASEMAARQAQERVPGLRTEDASARTALERARVAQEGGEAEVARARTALEAAVARQAQAVRDLAHAEQILRGAEEAETRLVSESARLAAEAEEHPSALAAAKEAVERDSAALKGAEAAATAATERSATLTARAEAVAQLLAAAQARARRAGEAMARLKAERARAERDAPDPATVAEAIAADERARSALLDARAAVEAGERDRGTAQAAAASVRERASQDEAARTKLAAEVSGLSQVLAVRDGEKWPPMVDRLEVPPGLEAALGAAFGEDLAAADDKVAARHWRDLPPLKVDEGKSLLGRVRAPAALRRALGRVRLVESEAEGDRLQAALQPGQTLVSAAGAMWRWDGYTVRAGAPAAAAVRLQHRNRLRALQVQLAEAGAKSEAARLSREAAVAAERAAVAADGAARHTLRGAERASEQARAAASSLRGRAEQSAARRADILAQIEAAAPEHEEAGAALEAARAERDGAPDVTLLRAEVERSRAALAATRGREREAVRAFEELERAGAARTSRLAVIERERWDGRMRAAEASGRAIDLRARAAEAATAAQALQGAPEAARRQAQAGETAFREAQAAHEAAASALAEAERAAEVAAGAARAAELTLYSSREALVRAEAAQEAAGLAWEAAESAVADRAGALTLPDAPADSSAAAEEKARGRWHRLAREREEMGPVNLRAEIEAEALGADVGTIVRERDELGTAIAKLRGGIGHLNREGRERLSEVFQQVDRHFQQLFARMFGGGRAHLALVGSDDPLLAGLEIYAQPPGKKLATLSLLSGGEQALTALSLIFAVFRCNPAPLCVLDEVDAPLDDANVERFCTLLTDMVAETATRFMVVTHHHLTMARMDRLYGVTMQERGVSRLLSVDLGAAVQMVEQVAAE